MNLVLNESFLITKQADDISMQYGVSTNSKIRDNGSAMQQVPALLRRLANNDAFWN